eukprot:7387019-Prorocentrum_lima.AAC.1
MTLLSVARTCPVTMGDILRGVIKDETADIFIVMASHEWGSFDFGQQKSLNPNSSLSAQTDKHRVVWLCPMEAVREAKSTGGGRRIERGIVWKGALHMLLSGPKN